MAKSMEEVKQSKPPPAMLVEDRIAELGLQEEYTAALVQVLSPNSISNLGSVFHLPIWLLIHANPRQRCLAALEAVKAQVTLASEA